MVTELRQRWGQAYDTHHHTVVLALIANGVRLDEARELAHDAWARIFEQVSTDRLESIELPGLVIRQAFFLLAESRRRHSTRAQRDLRVEEAMSVADQQPSPEDTVAGRQLLGVVAAAMAGSSERAQAVLCAVISGPDALHVELAKNEGVSLQRFRQILCEVRAQLRTALGRVSP